MRRQDGKVIVEKGDSIASIAHEMGIDFTALAQANKGYLPLQVGHPVRFPGDMPITTDAPIPPTLPPQDVGGEGSNGATTIHVTQEQIDELIADVQGYVTKLSAVEDELSEVKKLCADALEALATQGKTHGDEIAALHKRIDAILETAVVPATPG